MITIKIIAWFVGLISALNCASHLIDFVSFSKNKDVNWKSLPLGIISGAISYGCFWLIEEV